MRDVAADISSKILASLGQRLTSWRTQAAHCYASPYRLTFNQAFTLGAYVRKVVVKIGAAILGAHLNLPPDHITDRAAYIESWMSILKSDKRAFFHSAAQAQLAVAWLIARSPPPEPDHVEA